MTKSLAPFFLFLVFSFFPFCVHASYTFKNGKLIKSEQVATMSVQEHYSAAIDAFQKQNWDEVIHQSLIVVKNFSRGRPFAKEALYYLGVGVFLYGGIRIRESIFDELFKRSRRRRNSSRRRYNIRFKIAGEVPIKAPKGIFWVGRQCQNGFLRVMKRSTFMMR